MVRVFHGDDYGECRLLGSDYLLVTAKASPGTLIFFTPMIEESRSCKTSVLDEPHCVTSQKTVFFKIVLDAVFIK
jgi:hypothetical protein